MTASWCRHPLASAWLRAFCLACIALSAALSVRAAEPVRIGVAALRSAEQSRVQWEPLGVALKAAMPQREFLIEPLSLQEIQAAVASRQVDFVLTNPTQYILLAKRYGLSAPLATRVMDLQGQRSTVSGGVIFTRAGEPGINSLPDLRGRKVAAVDVNASASYQMQAYALLGAGVQVGRDLQLELTGRPIDKVVEMVLDGRADAGFVSTGFLERLVSEGRLDMRAVKILNQQNLPGFPVVVSTRLYPDWPFAALPHVDEELARDVTAALFRLQEQAPAVRMTGLRGFSVPADYTSYVELMQALRVPPYEGVPSFTLMDVWSRYRAEVTGGLLFLGLILALGIYLVITKRRLEAEQRAVLRHHAFTNQLIETANVVVLGLDAAGRVVIFNAKGEELTGYARQDVLGKEWFALTLPEADRSTRALFAQAMRTGEASRELESVVRTAAGEERLLSWRNSLIRNPGGESVYVSFGLDVTAQRRAERALEESRQHLERRVEERTAELVRMADSLRVANARQQAILDAASAGILLVRNRVIEHCNRRLEELAGYGPGELTGQPTRLLYVDDETWLKLGEAVYSQLRRGQTFVTEFLLQRKTGGTIWARLAARPVDADAADRGIVCLLDDITAQKEAAEALQRVSAEQQAILDTASSGILLLKERVVIRCNRRMHEMLGWPEGALIGKSPRAWYADQATFERVGQEAYDEVWRGLTHRREQLLQRRDGTPIWTRMSGRAVDPGDPGQGSVWVVDDIAAERAAIAEIISARAKAEDAARVKADFLANMSHEIRTPMNAVIGLTHLALKADPTQRQREYLLKIQRSSQHLLGIINDILDFSKIDAGKMGLEHVDFELERLLDNVVGLVADKSASKGLELIIDVAEDVPQHLVGDPLRISQVLINYVNNAVKFTEKGEIAIRVRVVSLGADELTLRFSVRDTGIGISDAQRAALFQSFHQLDSSTTRKYGGSGLGLVIAKRLAELMDGEVGVTSVPGAGSTFWFTARLGRSTLPDRRQLPGQQLFGRRVLLVDDNEAAREVVGEMLRSLRFVVVAVASGEDAIAELQRAAGAGEAYDLAFLDWQMPTMDGIMTARAIRGLALPVQPQLLMITAGGGRDELLRQAGAVNIEDVLIKPLNPSVLFDAVIRVLSERELPPRGAPVARSGFFRPVPALVGARALLVEDNEINQEVASELLRDAGLVVELAGDGAVALDKVQRGDYDIVLMDMQMPVMDGLSATREIRKLPGLQTLPILAMTANAMPGDRERCLEAGMNDHIAKPIDPELLHAKLREWLGLLKRPEAASGDGAAEAGARSADIQRLDGIAGLDPVQGLRLCLGRETLYFSLLAKFVAAQADAPARIAAVMAAADWLGAERGAHTLKGVAGQIGAVEVQARAGELEQAIRNRQPEAGREALARLAEIVPALVSAIALHFPHVEPRAVATLPADGEQAQAICARLARQLAEDDFSCGALLEEHRGLLEAALGDGFAQIATDIENYDFAVALAHLREAAEARALAL